MSANAEKILQEALNLPAQDRAEVFAALAGHVSGTSRCRA